MQVGDPDSLRIDSLETRSSRRTLTTARVGYALTSVFLATVMVLTVLDAVDAVDSWGVDDGVTSVTDRGVTLRVRHGTVTRPGLATPFELEVERTGDLDDPISIAVDRDYLHALDDNLTAPTASDERSLDGWVVYEFDPPQGPTFRWTFDARIEPSVQQTITGRVGLVDGDTVFAVAEFETRVRP